MSERIRIANLRAALEGDAALIPYTNGDLLALVEAVTTSRVVIHNGLAGKLVTVGQWEAARQALDKFDFGDE